MATKDFRDMSFDELNKKLLEMHRELFDSRIKKATDQLPKPHIIREIRRNIARAKTILSEKNRDGVNEV